MSKFSVLTVGDSEIDVFLKLEDNSSQANLNKESRELCFPYGQKILVDNGEFLVGGGAANVSVGLSRLGLSVGIVAEIGDDELSQKIINCLITAKVDSSHVIRTKPASASFSVGISFKAERTLFVHHIVREHNFSFDNIQEDWVYLGSVGKEWETAYKNTLDFIQSSGSKLAFAPGTTQIEAGYNGLVDVLKISDIVFLNKEEAVTIVNSKLQIANSSEQKKEIETLLKALQEMGSKVVVVTDGENGSHATNEKGEIFNQGIVQSQVVEKTGAGDAYASGFLGAILLRKSIEEAMQWGTINAAAVIGKVGAQEGLLTKEKIEERLITRV